MQRYKFPELTEDLVRNLMNLRREPGVEWKPLIIELTEAEQDQLDVFKNRLQH